MHDLDLELYNEPRSNVNVPIKSQYTTSYMFALSVTAFDINTLSTEIVSIRILYIYIYIYIYIYKIIYMKLYIYLFVHLRWADKIMKIVNDIQFHAPVTKRRCERHTTSFDAGHICPVKVDYNLAMTIACNKSIFPSRYNIAARKSIRNLLYFKPIFWLDGAFIIIFEILHIYFRFGSLN